MSEREQSVASSVRAYFGENPHPAPCEIHKLTGCFTGLVFGFEPAALKRNLPSR